MAFEFINLHGIAVILLAAIAFYLLARDILSVEMASLAILGGLALMFQAFPFITADGHAVHGTDFFSGFGHEALIAICCLMILGHAMVATGALEPVARALGRLWRWNAPIALLAVLIVSMALSGVLNDTPVVILMMPVLLSVALRTGTAPSKTLMPMNFAVLTGGMATSIGTSTNLLVVSIATDLGVKPFGMFDFTSIALTAAVPAILYLWLVAPRLLPDRRPPMESTAQRVYQAVLHIEAGSFADGKLLPEVLARAGGRMHVERVQRSSGDFVLRFPTLKLQAGDGLFVQDTRENIKEFEQVLGVKLHTTQVADRVTGKIDRESEQDREQLAEVVVSDHSSLAGRTLRDARFSDHYGVAVVALHRQSVGEILDRDLIDVPLMSGDVLLVQGPQPKVAELKSDPSMLVLDGRADLPHTQKAPHALLIMLLVVVAAGTGIIPIYVGALIGVIALLFTRTLLVKNLGRALKTDVILLIAASLALGKAVTDTGIAKALGTFIATHAAALPPSVTLAVLMVVMALLTNFVSNNAAAAVGTPLSVYVAQQLGLSAEPFVLAVLFGCNLSFATPMGYQTNILIMAAANYRFSDYIRVGLPLAIMLAGILSYTLSARYF
ncbi:MAG: SLC13 family permease [Steroidobacteraceae bacterium]